MTGFCAPTYTQIPNDFFDMVGDLDKAPMKVLLILFRETFGYHRDDAELSLRDLKAKTKLSQSSILRACEWLEDRGLIEKLPDGNKTLIWRVVVEDESELRKRLQRASTIEARRLHHRGAHASTIEAHSAVKEINKRNAEPALGSGSAGEEEAHVPAPKPPKFARAGLI
jgi:DNA-binding MarR family transcriptional regulator